MNEELVFNPTKLDISRSVFPVKRPDKGTGFVGRLNTLRPIEVLPGTTWDLNCANLIRFTTPVAPTMDNLFMDVYFYFTSNEMLLRRQSFSPSLLDGNHSFAAIMGAQDGHINMPFPDSGLEIPSIEYVVAGYNPKDDTAIDKVSAFVHQLHLLDQLGYPLTYYLNPSDVGTGEIDVSEQVDYFSCLAILGYISIWNEDFREPNCQNRFDLTIDNGIAKFDSDTVFHTVVDSEVLADGDYRVNDYGNIKGPLKYDTENDYLDSGDSCLAIAETFGVSRFHGLFGSLLPFPQRNAEPVYLPLGEMAPVVTGDVHITSSTPAADRGPSIKFVNSDGSGPSNSYAAALYAGSGELQSMSGVAGALTGTGYRPSNLWTDLSQATSASINTIRTAFQTQKWFEALARGGNADLDEYINSLFGVLGPIDVESKRPVYLGGKRIPINISQVNNTGTDTGETGAFSLTTDSDHYVKYHSKTYGMIYCVFCIRYADSFIDAPQKFLTKRSKFDFYFPQFANLGEEGYPKGLLGLGYEDVDRTADQKGLNPDVMGYQEYAADYRYDFGAVSGQLRFAPLNAWHFGMKLDTNDMDIAEWLDASSMAMVVDRTLKVSGKTARMQFMYDFLIFGKKYLPMPVNSIPGLVDHH